MVKATAHLLISPLLLLHPTSLVPLPKMALLTVINFFLFLSYIFRIISSNILVVARLKLKLEITRTTASLAARVSMSTHETTEGQAFSKSAFMLSITSNPRAEFRLGNAFFSPLKSLVSSRSTDPSQPYILSNQ